MYRVLNCLTTEHELWLVAVAGFVCLLTCLVAINFFHRARATSGNIRTFWIMTAGIVTGWGIWSTHFIAMLAYDPGIGIAYNIGLTVRADGRCDRRRWCYLHALPGHDGGRTARQ